MTKFLTKYKFSILTMAFFLFIGTLVYSNGLHGPFMGDDHVFFDQRMDDLRFLKFQFLPNTVYFRPLAHIVPILCHMSFGENVFSYHIFNLILFCAAAFCIYAFITVLFSDVWLGLLTGLFYLLHPINGIIVNYITASVFPIQVICMLASLWFIAIASEAKQSFMMRGMSVFFFALALMCHEMAMVLPIYAMCILVWGKGMSWKNAFNKTLPVWVLFTAYMIFHFKYASFNTNILGQISYLHIGLGQYLATLTRLICWYFSKLIFLSGIVLAWSTPVIKEEVGAWLMAFCFLIFGFAAAAVYCRRTKPLLLGLLWVLIGFIPLTLSCLAEPTQGFIIEPHWFVFSSIGFFLLLAFAIRKIPLHAIRIAAVFFLIFTWSLACRGYNFIWADEERYDLYWLKEAPDFKVPNSFLARIYFERNELERARYYFERCMVHTYADHVFYANIGLIDYLEGNWEAAKKNYAKALSLEPYMNEVLTNLGSMALKENHVEEAKDYFTRAIEADPVFQSTQEYTQVEETSLISLLKIYWDKKEYQEVATIATQLSAHSRRALTQYNVAIIFKSLGLKDQAQQAFERAKYLRN